MSSKMFHHRPVVKQKRPRRSSKFVTKTDEIASSTKMSRRDTVLIMSNLEKTSGGAWWKLLNVK
jgi:hypothetical protein